MLTKRQKQILNYIEKFIKKEDYAPSLEEIREYFGLASKSTVHHHIKNLIEKGCLNKLDYQARAIEISEGKRSSGLVKISLVGVIAAGSPIEAIEFPEIMKLSKSELSKSGQHYALRVQGDSMLGEGIFDGDIVVIRKQQTADNGQLVVAIVDDNEATLKKLFKEKGRFRLQPANQIMLPIYRKEVEIRGVVVKIIRNLEEKFSQKNLSGINPETLEYKKRVLLDRIRSVNPNSRNKYKRVVETPIRYAGGKSLAVGHIVELVPNRIKRLVSPFFGGGSVEIACNKYLGLEVIGFDIFDILINYWKLQIKNPKKLFKKLTQLKPNKQTYQAVKKRLKARWENRLRLSPTDLAAYYYFNHNLSYGPGFLGWPSSVYLNKDRYRTMLERVKNFSVKKMAVERASFEEVFKKYPNDFFYCDPPYLLGKDSKMFKGIYPMRNIPIHHNGFKHEKLRELLKNHTGGFILSYNNCQTIRDWYDGYDQFFPEWQYTMGQGEIRIGANRKNGNANHIKKSHEILIFCPPRGKSIST